MRLLVVTQYFWPEDFRVNELVRELVARGHQVTVLTGKPNYPGGDVFPEFLAAPDQFARYHGARVVRVPMFARRRGAARLALNYLSFAVNAAVVGAVRLARSDFDAVFVFEPSPVTVGIPAVLLRRMRGWPVAFWVLDQWPETLAAVGVVRSARGLSLVGRLVRFIYTRCDVVLSPSRLLMEQIARYTRPGQPVRYFPNWTEGVYVQSAEGNAHSAEHAAAPEIPPHEGAFTVLFAGNIGEAQDFPTILDAAERLTTRTDIRWVIVGDGRAAAWVRDEVVRRGLTDRVLLLGRHPSDRMPAFFRHADALLVSLRPDPIFAMTAPGKIQSYLASGRPVLAMLDGEGADVVRAANAGIAVRAGDAEGLAAAVEQLAALPRSERERLGENGAAYARREFSRDVLVERLEHTLHAITTAPRTVPETA